MSKNITVDIPQEYMVEMSRIKKSLRQYPGHEVIASSLGKLIPQEIVAGLIGCIIPESGTNHTILNAKEYTGRGVSGTEGWNCGEGLVQWTYWKYKLPLIQTYNADSRSTQKLPTTWDVYKQGLPIGSGNRLYAIQDGRHIAGLSLDNQMLFLVLYYNTLIQKLNGETNLAVIVAHLYQRKAGVGYFKDETNPIIRAYKTSQKYYQSSTDNHYLQSLKIAQEYLDCPVVPSSIPISEYMNVGNISYNIGSNDVDINNCPEISGMNDRKKVDTKGIVLGYHMKQK